MPCLLLALALAAPVIKVVGFDAAGENALLRVEAPGPNGEPDKLWVLVAPTSDGWLSKTFDGYEGLPEWKIAHPDAKAAELEQAAKKLRGASWKKIEKALGTGWTISDIASAPRKDGPNRASEFELPAVSVSIRQTCTQESAKSCSLIATEGGRRVPMASGYEAASIFAEPNQGRFVVVVERDAPYDGGQGIAVHFFRSSDLRGAAAEPKTTPGQIYGLAGPCYIYRRAELASIERSVDKKDFVKLVAGEPGGTELLPVTSPNVFGGWYSGFIHRRCLGEPAPKAIANVMALEIQDEVVGTGNNARYLITLKNPLAEPVTLAKTNFYGEYNNGRCNQMGGPPDPAPQTIPAGASITIFDGTYVVNEQDHSCESVSPAEDPGRGPVKRAKRKVYHCLRLESGGLATCQSAHTVEIPVRAKR